MAPPDYIIGVFWEVGESWAFVCPPNCVNLYSGSLYSILVEYPCCMKGGHVILPHVLSYTFVLVVTIYLIDGGTNYWSKHLHRRTVLQFVFLLLLLVFSAQGAKSILRLINLPKFASKTENPFPPTQWKWINKNGKVTLEMTVQWWVFFLKFHKLGSNCNFNILFSINFFIDCQVGGSKGCLFIWKLCLFGSCKFWTCIWIIQIVTPKTTWNNN